MRPTDVQLNPHVEMPAWLRSLQQAIHAEDLAPLPEALTPMAALREVVVVASGSLPESRDDRASLRNDLAHALDSLGQEASALARAALDDFRQNTLSRLPEMLARPDSAPLAAAAADVLSARLQDDAVVAAVWRDVVTAFETNSPYQTCALRLGALWELLDARGHFVEAEAEQLARIINDSAQAIANAGGQVSPPRDGESYDFEERAGMSERERLQVVEQYVSKQLAEEPAVVWLVFFDASVADTVIDVGPVRFIDAGRMHDRLQQAPVQAEGFGLPPGHLGAFVAAQLLGDIPESDRAVIARVETTTRRGHAVDWARGTASALLDAATVGEMHRGWQLAAGHLLNSEHAWSHRRIQRVPQPDLSQLMRQALYRPDSSVKGLDARLVTAWEQGRPDAVDAVELAHWHRTATSLADERFRLALAVRNLERTLPAARLLDPQGRPPHWTRVASFYLKERSCWSSLEDEVDELGLQAVSAMPPTILDEDLNEPADPEEPSKVKAKLDAHDRFYDDLAAIIGSREIETRGQLVTHASEIASLMPLGSTRRRLLDVLSADVANAKAAEAWIGRLGAVFDTLLARTARLRNAVLHGGGTSSAVLATTLPFVEALALVIVRDALAAATEASTVERYLEDQRVRARERTAALADGQSLASML